MSARSLVLGAHTALPAASVEPFARSLRATGFEGRLVIFAGRCDGTELHSLRELADEVIELDAEYPAPPALVLGVLRLVRSTRGLRRLYAFLFAAAARLVGKDGWSRLEYHLEGLQSLRYVHYRHYIESLESELDAVLLTDLRDVVFQGDPLAEAPQSLELYLEDASVRIGAEAFNTRWIRDLYGESEVVRLRDKVASCSGTVVATRAGALGYLAAMSGEVAKYRRPMGSHDQGVHNVLLHRDAFPATTVVPNGRGRVLTLGRMEAWPEAPDGTVLNEDGSVPAVIHQWDRHAELVERIEARDR